MGLKAPRNYSASFLFNKILIWLCEGQKPPNSMISGSSSPREPLFMHFYIPNYFNTYKKFMETRLQQSIFTKLMIYELCFWKCVYRTFWNSVPWPFEFLEWCKFDNWNFETLKCWNVAILKFWVFVLFNLEICDFWNLAT